MFGRNGKLVELYVRIFVGAIFVFSLNFTLFTPDAVHASHAGLNLTTSPLPISLIAKPGTTVSADLRVKNSGTHDERLRVEVLKFGAFGEEGKPAILDPEPEDEFLRWVKFSETTFTAQPNVWKTIKMTISVPQSAAFGYYYAVTFSRAGQEKVEPGQRQTALKGAAATLVLLEAEVPNAKRKLEVAEFKSERRVYEYVPATFSVKLRNSGNVHVAPSGSIFITKGDKTISTINFNAEKGNILPGTNRIYFAQWTDAFPAYVEKVENDRVVLDSSGKAVKELKWDLTQIQKLRFGKYTANLLLAYDDGKRDIPIEAQVSFWVIPWKLLLGMLVIILLVGVGLWSTGRNVFKSVSRRR